MTSCAREGETHMHANICYEAGRRDERAVVATLLDEWEASYGITPLPSHWGIAERIAGLRAATEETTP